ncbi:MAG: GTPase, partial [Pirellulales bacterium]
MKIGLVGYQGSGKSTLFEWLTGVAPDAALAHAGQSAMATVPDARVEPLAAIYRPKKVTLAALELVDTPGLSRTHEGNPARLGLIREAGCLVLVVPAFDRDDPLADLEGFHEDLLLADMEIVAGRIGRLTESVKKPRPNRELELAELAALQRVLSAL